MHNGSLHEAEFARRGAAGQWKRSLLTRMFSSQPFTAQTFAAPWYKVCSRVTRKMYRDSGLMEQGTCGSCPQSQEVGPRACCVVSCMP